MVKSRDERSCLTAWSIGKKSSVVPSPVTIRNKFLFPISMSLRPSLVAIRPANSLTFWQPRLPLARTDAVSDLTGAGGAADAEDAQRRAEQASNQKSMAKYFHENLHDGAYTRFVKC